MGTFSGFKCDKCGQSFMLGKEDYRPISVSLHIRFGYTYPDKFTDRSGHAVWCRSCLMSTGFHHPVNEEDKKVAAPKELTFEEKFSILIEDLGFTRAE